MNITQEYQTHPNSHYLLVFNIILLFTYIPVYLRLDIDKEKELRFT